MNGLLLNVYINHKHFFRAGGMSCSSLVRGGGGTLRTRSDLVRGGGAVPWLDGRGGVVGIVL